MALAAELTGEMDCWQLSLEPASDRFCLHDPGQATRIRVTSGLHVAKPWVVLRHTTLVSQVFYSESVHTPGEGITVA